VPIGGIGSAIDISARRMPIFRKREKIPLFGNVIDKKNSGELFFFRYFGLCRIVAAKL
tara:strand:+ start:64 stop:237 length:174 start_codon:yes stop_codon:yes gene_type:complete